jgi:hypothetical protein
MAGRIEGKVTFITGAAHGQGRDTCAQPIIDAHPSYQASFGQILFTPPVSQPEDIADCQSF